MEEKIVATTPSHPSLAQRRRSIYRHAFVLAFGEDWEGWMHEEYIQGCSIFSHTVTSLIMALYVAEEWPKQWPSRSMDVIWQIWHTTFCPYERVQWQWYHGASGDIRACHQPTDWITSGPCYLFAEVLCRCFLYQAWLVATAPEVEASPSKKGAAG